ncbi:hypothetical protein H4V95_001716 [Arthrobacter sp. CAN_C5]|nr:hypothetical protein [Arthrobacter sp. CAN_C5]
MVSTNPGWAAQTRKEYRFRSIHVAKNLGWNGKVKSDGTRQCQSDDSVHGATELTNAPASRILFI